MKVKNIYMPYVWEEIDSENAEIDIFVETDDGYNYVLSLGTPKYFQTVMDLEKKDYYGPGYPCIIVNKLTPEILEQVVKAFAEEDEEYWLKFYHFGGFYGFIDESIFDQLKAKHIKELEELEEDDLDD